MVLQNYGLNISEDESIENRLVDDSDVVISDRKGVNYIDNMLAMSPFAGDYPPTANYINYTDLDASYPTQGKFYSPSFTKKTSISGPMHRRWCSIDRHKCTLYCFIVHFDGALLRTSWSDET